MLSLYSCLSLLLASPYAFAATVQITDIQGDSFKSPLVGETVTTTGVVTAKGSEGFYLVGPASSDNRVSNGLQVFTTSSSVLSQVAVGDNITVTGKVEEFVSSSDPNDLSGTELEDPTDITVHSKNVKVTPVVLGASLGPPTQQYSSLDTGPDGFLSVPNNASQIDKKNPTLQPDSFALDFWESLEGQLVTITKPTVTDFQDDFGEFWVYGDWPVTGKNSRGGLTINTGPDGVPDGNPETVIIGQPLDGTNNPNTSVGQVFDDITGVVQFQFGFFYVLPLTKATLVSTPSTTIAMPSFSPSSDPCVITIGDYNIDNFAPTAPTMKQVAGHIATDLKSPDIVFLQEIQDNSGATDNGVVDAMTTLTNLANAVKAVNGVEYSFLEISPQNDQDGGEPGGNIRVAYLFRPDKVKLAGGTTAGTATEATAVTSSGGALGLTLNPGRVDPSSSAWDDSRKPLAAVWESALSNSTGDRFFTINVHLTAKDGSSSVQGNARPPVNLGVQQRTDQVNTVAAFVNTILAEDESANVVVAGDHNEFLQASSVFAGYAPILTDIDVVADVSTVERYTYVFDNTNEQLDHVFLSASLASRPVNVFHVHVNNWAPSLAARASDHDPTIAQFNICSS